MYSPFIIIIVIVFVVSQVVSVELDIVNCGIDDEIQVAEGDIPIEKYPWLGILYYTYYGDAGENRAVTTVVLIQAEFCVGVAADIGPMPKYNFRANSRVLLGEDWRGTPRRVRNYVIHPEYDVTHNTLALIQLRMPVRDTHIIPVCPPPDRLRNPIFHVAKFKEEYDTLDKQMLPVAHVPGNLCKEFYERANLYSEKMRPPHVACAVSLDEDMPCVWNAGAALVSRDIWGRWILLGLGVRGPGCGAPTRFLDMMSYYPWVKNSLYKFRQISISKINNQKYVLRTAGSDTYQRFGNCDPEEKINLLYREQIELRTNNNQFQFLMYNLTIRQEIEFTCLTLQLVNASAVSEMRIKHYCTRHSYGPPCYKFLNSYFDISVYLMFSDTCWFEMVAWGGIINMTLLDIKEWKLEEGTYYDDVYLSRDEYRGPTHETEFGYEPLDIKTWQPDYDVWTTTEFDNSTWSSTTAVPRMEISEEDTNVPTGFIYRPTTASTTTTTSTTTKPPKKTFKKRCLHPERWSMCIPYCVATCKNKTITIVCSDDDKKHEEIKETITNLTNLTTTTTTTTTTKRPCKPGCICKRGYFKNAITNKCITRAQCLKGGR